MQIFRWILVFIVAMIGAVLNIMFEDFAYTIGIIVGSINTLIIVMPYLFKNN